MVIEYVLWSALVLMNYDCCMDMIRIKAVSRECAKSIVLLAVDGFVLHSNKEYYDIEGGACMLLACLCAGLCTASLQRFWIALLVRSAGVVPEIEESNRQLYQDVMKQKLNKRPVDFIFSAGSTFEIALELLMFMMASWCFSFVVGSCTFMLAVFCCGHTLEYHCAARLKLFVQFCDMDDAKWPTYGTSPLLHRFLCNAHTWYWTHILRSRPFKCCFGFSSQFWDTLFGTNPMGCRLLSYYYAPAPRFLQSCPLPFVDFLLNDYHAEGVVVRGLWANYLHESNLRGTSSLLLAQNRNGLMNTHVE